MTTSVCLNCGTMKGSSWVQCTSCGFDPITEIEFAYAMAFSDHHFSSAQLQEIGSIVAGGAIPALDGKQEAALLDAVRVPMIQSLRTAKVLRQHSIEGPIGWLSKATTAIVLDAHGHRAESVRIGKEISQNEYRRFKDDRGLIYVIERTEKGQLTWDVVHESAWLAVYDIFVAKKRQAEPVSLLLKHINSS